VSESSKAHSAKSRRSPARSACRLGLCAILLAACGSRNAERSATESPLRLDDSSNEIVLSNTTNGQLIAGGYELEERSGENWVSADETLDLILGEADVTVSSLALRELGPGGEHRFPIGFLDKLPPGEYRVIVHTGDDNPRNELDSRHTLTFTR